MRVVDVAIPIAELKATRNTTYKLTASNERLSFSGNTYTNADIDKAIPQTYCPATTLNAYVMAAWRNLNGDAWIRNVDINAGYGLMDWELYTSAGTRTPAARKISSAARSGDEYTAMRYGLTPNVLVAPKHTSSIQLYKGDFDTWLTAGTSATFGPAFGPAFANASDKIVRVEAVCPVTSGAVVVAVGTHDFVLKLSTIQFYLVDSTTARLLDNMVQMPLDESYVSWYGNARYCGNVSAVYNSTTGTTWIVCNGHAKGMPLEFGVTNGVESMIAPIMAIDPVNGSVGFKPATISMVGTRYMLTGHIRYTWADATTLEFDCYLQSVDGYQWSIGERNYYLCDDDLSGIMFYPGPIAEGSMDEHLFYGGNAQILWTRATRDLCGTTVNAGWMQKEVKMIPGAKLSQGTGEPFKLNGNLWNPSGALSADPKRIGRGSILYLEMGQGAIQSPIGVYDLDNPSGGVTIAGFGPLQFSARDLASKALIRHNLPVTLDYWGQDTTETSLADDTDLLVMTRGSDGLIIDPTAKDQPDPDLYDITMDTVNGLRSKAINNPFVMYADTLDAPDSLIKATVEMPDTGDLYALPAVMLIWAGDETQAYGCIIPKESSWNTKSKPRLVKTDLAAFDPATNTGGFILESRYTGLWDSESPMPHVLEELASHYLTETDFVHGAGETRDYALHVHGGRVTLLERLHDLVAETMAANAGYTAILDYRFGTDAPMGPTGRTRPGIALNTDAWASKAAFAHSAYADLEIGLTSARKWDGWANYTISGATEEQVEQMGAWATLITSAQIPGLHHWEGGESNAWIVATDAGSTPISVDLSDYFVVGQIIKITTGGTSFLRQVGSFSGMGNGELQIVDVGGGGGWYANMASGQVSIKSGDYWGWASSATGTTHVNGGGGGDTLYVPGATVTPVLMTMRGAFTGRKGSDYIFTIRYLDSDGMIHRLLSGGWDTDNPTNPTLASSWQLIGHHNVIGKWDPAYIGLPFGGNVLMEHELAGYSSDPITLWREECGLVVPVLQGMMVIPTYYATPETQSSADVTAKRIYNKWIYANTTWNRPGDDLGDDLPSDCAGMLVEITGRNGAAKTIGDPVQLYVASKGGGAAGRDGHIILDAQPGSPVVEDNFVIVSARGKFGTIKAQHPADTPVCYYPSTTKAPAFITVSALDVYAGINRSTEDLLATLCYTAGVRTPVFRNYMTGAAAKAGQTLTLTTTPADLDLLTTVADFDLAARAHIDSTGWLRVDFRGAYRLMIKETATGKVTVGLAAPSSSITAGGLDTQKWLEYAEVELSDRALCAAAADNVHLRISMFGDKLAISINSAPIWTFNLARYPAYRSIARGSIAVSYSSAVTGNSCIFRALELWQPVINYPLAQGASTSAAIAAITRERYTLSMAQQDGGILFTQFTSRDPGSALRKKLSSHLVGSDDNKVAAHVQVAGAVSGGYLDHVLAYSEGYSYKIVTGSSAASVQDAGVDAQLIEREAAEFATTETVTGKARIADEPEDLVTLEYTPDGDAPQQAIKSMVITSLDWTFGADDVEASYKLRGHKEWAAL